MSVSPTHSAPLNLVQVCILQLRPHYFFQVQESQFIRLTPFKLLKHHLLLYLPLVTYGLQCPLPHSPMHPPQFLEILHSAIPCFETNSVLFCEGNDPNTRRHSDISIRGPICHDSWHFFSNLLLFHIAQTFKFQKIVDFSQLNRFPL